MEGTDIELESAVVEVDVGINLKALRGTFGLFVDDRLKIVNYIHYLGGGRWCMIYSNGVPMSMEIQTQWAKTGHKGREQTEIYLTRGTCIECRHGHLHMTSALLKKERGIKWAQYFGNGMWLASYRRIDLLRDGELVELRNG